MKAIEQHTADAVRSRAEWLEDVIAGLLINGVRQDEIEIQNHADGRTVVTVRGEPKYQWRLLLVG